MKKAFIILSALFIIGCEATQLDKKEYRFKVTYTNGDVEILTFKGYGENYFTLDKGDLKTTMSVTLISGVRDFKLLSVINQGPITEKERATDGCNCAKVTLISKEKE